MAPVATSYDTVFFDIGDTLVSSAQWVSGAQQMLDDVRDRGLAIGLISNTGDLDRVELRRLLPADFDFEFFDEDLVILSSEVHVEKPDHRIFLLAAQRAATVPSKCVFIGEALAESLAAQQVGFRAFRLGSDTEADFGEIVELLES